MSLPTTSKPSQLSIRSFFQTQSPKYAPPPSTSNSANATTNSTSTPPPAAASPAVAEQQPPSAPLPTVDAAIPPIPANLLPREAAIRPLADADLSPLRRINALLLPVSYPDAFYRDAVDPASCARFSRVITWEHDGYAPKVVGAVICRVEPAVAQAPQGLYIRSLCLLSPYRGMGLVNAALDNIVATAAADPALDVRVVTAHVWEQNDEGLAWYQARGFRPVGQPIKGYYLKLRPDAAFLMQRDVSASVRSALPSAETQPPARPVALTPTAAVANLPPPPPSNGNARPPLTTGQSFQNKRAETEWNDLPAEMAPTLLGPPKSNGETASGTSSRSSSTAPARKKKDRSYPAAAFGK